MAEKGRLLSVQQVDSLIERIMLLGKNQRFTKLVKAFLSIIHYGLIFLPRLDWSGRNTRAVLHCYGSPAKTAGNGGDSTAGSHLWRHPWTVCGPDAHIPPCGLSARPKLLVPRRLRGPWEAKPGDCGVVVLLQGRGNVSLIREWIQFQLWNNLRFAIRRISSCYVATMNAATSTKCESPTFFIGLCVANPLFFLRYGFYDEIQKRYPIGAYALWNLFNQTFAWMPYSALVGGRILCGFWGFG